jgi:hypothetical protein
VDSAGGNDVNDGTSSASPWKTLAHTGSAMLDSPATLHLKRGEVWHEGLTLTASDVTVDAYGSGAAPVLDGSVPVPRWQSLGGDLYSATLMLTEGQGLGNLSQGGTLLTFEAWQGSAAATLDGMPAGSYSYDQATSTLYVTAGARPADTAYLASVVLIGITVTGVSDVSVENLEVRRMSLHGIQFTDCLDCTVSSSTLSGIGGAVIGAGSSGSSPYLCAGNGIQYGGASSGGGVSDVTVSDVFDSCLTVQTYVSGVQASDVTFSNSSVSRCGFAGIELSVLSAGGSRGSSLKDIHLVGLTVSASGRGWSGRRYGTEGEGLRIEADAGAGSMSGITVETTRVTGAAGDGVRLAGEVGSVTLDRLETASNAGYGIEVTEPSAKSLLLKLTASLVYTNGQYGILYDAPAAAGLRLYQDTFYDDAGIDVAIMAQQGVADIRNGLFYDDNGATSLYSAGALAGVTLDHDCYQDGTNMIGYAGTAYSSLAGFTTATGLEAHGDGAGPVSLANPANGDFKLGSGSSCLGLGDPTVGVTQDYLGKSFGDPPSSGAYEYPQ